MAVEWTAICIAILVCLLIILVKFLLWNCIKERRVSEDGRPILSTRRDIFWQEYDRMRRERLRNAVPPPDFDEALRTSRPISYIEIDEEAPPPSYEDFLKRYSPSTTPTTIIDPLPVPSFEDNFVDIPITPIPEEDYQDQIVQPLSSITLENVHPGPFTSYV